ncbi:OX-2 membrane glycoprotein-like [Spea bombifrons]|uniref:OX-2 membrane glycoprotein-like n=1 Tax=Spea bombifrons TaxID=233779 RepID=UPI00234AB05C|nr:OX-2 membrane glycoprotein-like [Spea bombifrons]
MDWKVKGDGIFILCIVCFVCVTSIVSVDVLVESPKPARVGESVTLKCSLQTPNLKVKQVTWKKFSKKGVTQVATYTAILGALVSSEYEKVLNITVKSLQATAITIWKTKASDDGTYQCIFNVFAHGAIVRNISVSLYEPIKGSLQKYNESADAFLAKCVTTGWPSPDISWIGVGSGHTNGSYSETINETATFTNWILVKKLPKSNLMEQLECRVHHLGYETIYKMPKQPHAKSGLQPIIIALIVGLVLLVIGVVAAVVCRSRRRSSQHLSH